MTSDDIAEALERARYEQLRGNRWEDLRDGEREARVGMARQALEDSGVAEHVTALAARSAEADGFEALLAQRDAELARRVAEHDQEVARLTAAVADARAELDAALVRTTATEAVRDRLEAVVAAVRAVVDAAEVPAVAAAGDVAAADDAAADLSEPPASPVDSAHTTTAAAEPRPERKVRFGRPRSAQRVPG